MSLLRSGDAQLPAMLQRGASIRDIESFLDGLESAARLGEVRAVRGRLVGRLYDTAVVTEPLTVDDIVPQSTPVGATLTFQGRNSLPMFSSFEKRFSRTQDGAVFGYNEAPTRAMTGPGYFLVSEADDRHRGELLFDYTRAPPFEPAGWPRFQPNDRLLSRVVFMDMHDFVRRVARGVLVGTAYKRGVEQHAWFSLTRA